MKKIMTALLGLTLLTATLAAQGDAEKPSDKKAATTKKKKSEEKSATMARKAGNTQPLSQKSGAKTGKVKKAATKKVEEK